MRVSGLVIFVLLLLTGGFVYLGYSAPELSYRTQIDVKAPVEVAFAGFTDSARMGEWKSDFISIQLLRGEPNQVGSVYRLTLKQADRNAIVTRELVAFRQNERVAYDLEHGTYSAAVEVLFEPTGTGTFMTIYNTVRGDGLFWRAALQLGKNRMMERQQQDYQRLKALLESS